MPDEKSRIADFIRDAKEHGVEDSSIILLLQNQGWSDRKIQSALTAYYESALGVSVPLRGGRSENAREAFFYLLSFAMLGVWVVALVWLGDLLIDRAFPNTLDDAGVLYARSSIAWQMASIIVTFPIFLWINYLIGREIARRPETLDSGVRKWLTYVALVVTAATLAGDGIWFLTTFLTGDISQRFVAKAVMLFVIVGGVYWYYLATIRADRWSGSYNRSFGIAASAGVLLALIVGFVGIGSPAHGRQVNFDNQRTADLNMLALRISGIETSTKHLPASLHQIDPAQTDSTDPETRAAYVYIKGKGANYQLCATFATDTRDDVRDPWRHPSGRSCFRLDAVNPEVGPSQRR